MLSIKNLHITVNDKRVVNGVSLTIRPGEIHALMGPNGSGKSSLAMAIVGHPAYRLQTPDSRLQMDGMDIIDKTPDERARMGLFLAMQYPVGIDGVTVEQLLRRAEQEVVNSAPVERSPLPWSPSTRRGVASTGFGRTSDPPTGGSGPSEKKIDVLEFRKNLEKLAGKVGVSRELLRRSVNVGFSGGEKKRLEILQMLVLKPKYAILDETDSGLDVDAMRTIAAAVKNYVSARGTKPSSRAQAEGHEARGYSPRAASYEQPAVLVITHYARLLKHLKPDYVHIMKEGKIVESGNWKLAGKIEEEGYEVKS